MSLRILLLSDSHSEHTEKWAIGLANKGLQIGIFSFNRAPYDWIQNHSNITLLHESNEVRDAKKQKTKFSYLTLVFNLKKAIREFSPDILHAHYASSYGLIGALSGFHPFIISVWGSDVYQFPNKSFLHKAILKFNLRKADRILSTSYTMRKEAMKYTEKEIYVTPFGVDTEVFKKKNINKDKDVLYIGTIKAIENKYGIKYIIEAAKILKHKFPNKKFKFLLIGPGSLIPFYKNKIVSENLEETVDIIGRVPYEEVVNYHNKLDIFLNVSIDDSESFGVAVVEALACETPVIVSNVGGLMEVIENGKYGVIVKKENGQEIADAIEKLILDSSFLNQIGVRGREHVKTKYDLNVSLNEMIKNYTEVIKLNEFN